MTKQKLTILLVVIMCLSPISGLGSVLCHGSDGHVTVEPFLHSHCECPESDVAGIQDKPSEFVIELSNDHDHCRDTLVTSNLVVPIRKNIKLTMHDISTTILFQRSTSTQSTSSFGYLASGRNELSPFFTPLRVIILLA